LDGFVKGSDDAILLGIGHLGVERENDGVVLGVF
jgi:hypothetical protein